MSSPASHQSPLDCRHCERKRAHDRFGDESDYDPTSAHAPTCSLYDPDYCEDCASYKLDAEQDAQEPVDDPFEVFCWTHRDDMRVKMWGLPDQDVKCVVCSGTVRRGLWGCAKFDCMRHTPTCLTEEESKDGDDRWPVEGGKKRKRSASGSNRKSKRIIKV